MALQKQAKVLHRNQVKTALAHIAANSRNPERDTLIFQMSHRAGMRAVEISKVKWQMVLGVDRNLEDYIALLNEASKGKSGGRRIPMHPDLKNAFASYVKVSPPEKSPRGFVIQSERSSNMSAGAITMWFYHLYKKLGYTGASSHSGRRGFVTSGARKLSAVGASLRDLQALTGHKHLSSLQRYIDGNTDVQRKLVNMI